MAQLRSSYSIFIRLTTDWVIFVLAILWYTRQLHLALVCPKHIVPDILQFVQMQPCSDGAMFFLAGRGFLSFTSSLKMRIVLEYKKLSQIK